MSSPLSCHCREHCRSACEYVDRLTAMQPKLRARCASFVRL